jgi:hypothetical protein
MSPFTADCKVLTEIFGPDNELWKSLSGPIESIKFLNRKTEAATKNGSYVQSIGLCVTTMSLGESPEEENLEVQISVKAHWEFMTLQKVEVL